MNTSTAKTPSRNGIGSGLHIGQRPTRPADVNTTDKIGTQHTNNPAPSRRGYA